MATSLRKLILATLLVSLFTSTLGYSADYQSYQIISPARYVFLGGRKSTLCENLLRTRRLLEEATTAETPLKPAETLQEAPRTKGRRLFFSRLRSFVANFIRRSRMKCIKLSDKIKKLLTN